MEYQVLWHKDGRVRPPLSWVAQTRRGPGFVRAGTEPTLDFHVDFEGPALKKVTDAKLPDAVFSVDSNGEIVEKRIQRNPVREGVRVSLKVKRADPAKPLELRGFLRDEAETLSETWAYILPPD
jgi:glucans biosynthesis protein